MKINLAVFFGGRSVEHEVSVITGVQTMMSLDRNKYNIIPVYIAKDGTMYSGLRLFDIDNYKDIPSLLAATPKVVFASENGRAVMKYQKKRGFTEKGQSEIDMAIPAVHGTNCEDGTLQGFLDFIGIPYTGSGILSSALGMDKAAFKRIMSTGGLPVLPCVAMSAREYAENPCGIVERVQKEIGFSAIVKPVNLGSSVGISKVSNADELQTAAELAFSFADRILIERAVENLKEINCSVLGDSEDCSASVCEEPAMSGDILSYDDKYVSSGKGNGKGMASLARKIPADLDEETSANIRNIACRAFKALDCAGVCRIDFLLDTKSGEIFINEFNTIPGSMAFYLWEASGMKYPEMLDKMIEIAYKRKRRSEKLMYTIDVNLLSNNALSGGKGGKFGKQK